MSIVTTNKSISVFPLFVLIMLLTAVPSTFGNASEQQTANRITVRGQVFMDYIIPEQDVLIPVRDQRYNYTSLDLESVNRDQVQIHTEPAVKMRLAFREELPKKRQLRPANWFGEMILDEDGRFEIEIDLDKKLPAVYRNKQGANGSGTVESDDEVESIYMVLRGGIRSENYRNQGYRVLGFHELELEEGKKSYEVEISFQALLPRTFSGVVQNIAGKEDINASVRHTARMDGYVFSRGTSPCGDDGSFEITIPPLAGAEVEVAVRGLNWIEFDRETMSTNWIPLKQILKKDFFIEVQERPTPSVVFDVEFIDKEGKTLNLKRSERQNYFIGFLKGNIDRRDNIAFSLTGDLWQSVARGKVYYWDLEPGEKHLLARYMMEQRKITPKTIEIIDLKEEESPQVINVQIVHKP